MTRVLLSDPHLWTAGAYCVIGLLLILLALHVWWAHPLKRAFIFGPYLTETGARLVLHLWPLVFLFGAFIASCAADHAADSLAMVGLVSRSAVNALGFVEAVISWWTAVSMVWLLARKVWGREWTRR